MGDVGKHVDSEALFHGYGSHSASVGRRCRCFNEGSGKAILEEKHAHGDSRHELFPDEKTGGTVVPDWPEQKLATLRPVKYAFGFVGQTWTRLDGDLSGPGFWLAPIVGVVVC